MGADDAAYFRLLAGLWAKGSAFTLVEHDVIPSVDALASFDLCPNEWCAAPYPYAGGLYCGLGCTRFRQGIMSRHPDLFAAISGLADAKHPPMHWCRLDFLISQALSGLGERRCEGHPPVGHRHSVPTHDCTINPTEEH